MLPADPESPTSIAITGGGGALGSHLLRHLLATTSLPLRVLVHRTPLSPELMVSRVTTWPGDLRDPESLVRWLEPGCTVIHLAFSAAMHDDDQRRAIEHLADACARHGVRSIVHCSTAVVVGRTRTRVVTEDTPCEPVTPYERAKFDIEQVFERATRGRVPLVIARPTAIFGPGLRNLLSLADSLSRGGLAHYLRASLFGGRQLHLVPVETVVSALTFLALALARPAAAAAAAASENAAPASRYIISADIEPGGDFRSVERRLRRALGIATSRLPPAPIPAAALRIALRAAGRSDADPARIYDGSRLRRTGFTPAISLETAIDGFAAWYRSRRQVADSAVVRS